MATASATPEPRLKVVVPMGKSKGGSKGTIKLKRPAPKHADPGNWQEGRVIEVEKPKKPSAANNADTLDSPNPLVNPLSDDARATFATGRPLEDILELQVCKHCKKSVLKTAMHAHLGPCLKAKKDKAQRKKEAKEQRERERRGIFVDKKNEDAEGEDAEGSADDTRKESGKKRKAGEMTGGAAAADGAMKKKKKNEELKKIVKTKGPVDVERQCGVLKDGVPCARSLTCKSHSMGAKRAVPGRSLPYDMLLSQYQKKNQAKQQKAALSNLHPLSDDDALLGPILDSDEELASIQHALSLWAPQPVVPQPVHIPISTRYADARLYEQLFQATNGFTINILKVGTDEDDAKEVAAATAAEAAAAAAAAMQGNGLPGLGMGINGGDLGSVDLTALNGVDLGLSMGGMTPMDIDFSAPGAADVTTLGMDLLDADGDDDADADIDMSDVPSIPVVTDMPLTNNTNNTNNNITTITTTTSTTANSSSPFTTDPVGSASSTAAAPRRTSSLGMNMSQAGKPSGGGNG